MNTFDGDIFDEDRVYPTEKYLEYITEWGSGYPINYAEFLDNEVFPGWYYPTLWRKSEIIDDFGGSMWKYEISTGGWSGNESIIEAMKSNILFWMMCWQQSRRGGHYIFYVKKEK